MAKPLCIVTAQRLLTTKAYREASMATRQFSLFRTCSKCKVLKPIEDYHRRPDRPGGRQYRCKDCERLYQKSEQGKLRSKARTKRFLDKMRLENRAEYDRRARESNLKRKYGISDGQYREMLSAQNGQCAICGTLDPKGRNGQFHIDHDHDTGKIRALLCNLCNHGLGAFRDKTELLSKAIDYLNHHKE